MKRLNSKWRDHYLKEDNVAHLSASAAATPQLTSQRWLDESAPKRCIFHELYGDCLLGGQGASLLDVGGGLTAMTVLLTRRGRYGLIDPLFHETPENMSQVLDAGGGFVHFRGDWLESEPGTWDLIVANDLFPNVDQRLSMFLCWAVARAREVRLSLTFYNKPRWFCLQREGLDERLTMLAFDGPQTRTALEPFASRIKGWEPRLFEGDEDSVFPNGRQVVTCSVRGDLQA